MLWPREAGAPYDLWRHFVVERKALRDSDRKSLEGTVERGVEQTLGHMKKRDAEEGHPVVFDRRAARAPAGPPARHPPSGERERDGRRVTVWTL